MKLIEIEFNWGQNYKDQKQYIAWINLDYIQSIIQRNAEGVENSYLLMLDGNKSAMHLNLENFNRIFNAIKDNK